MKLSRRCFLSFVVGGAAGTALSPLPWKLTDDLSIWSQNWSWTPVPPDGEYTQVNSTCTLCPGGCGIGIRKAGKRAVKIEGLAGHPVNDGGVCLLGLSGLQLLYGPARVKTPLKRTGKRGGGQWQAISWKQAIKEVTEKLKELRKKNQPQSLASIGPNGSGTVSALISRFMKAYGSSNDMKMASKLDSDEQALFLTQGIQNGMVGADVENADFILSFGCAVLDGYGSPVRMFRANSRWKENSATLIQIEPRQSNTAAKADQWLPINPGGEADLALAMANIIIKENLYNSSFVSDNCDGLNSFVQMLYENYMPEDAARRIGIDVQTIIDLAHRFATAARPLAINGYGKGQNPSNLKETLAIHALNALVGNIGKKGGITGLSAYDYIRWPKVVTDTVAAAGLKESRLDGAGTNAFPHAKSLPNRFFDKLSAGNTSIQALLVAEANPCYSMPDTAKIKRVFDSIPFIVSFSSFMDETAMMADLILPNHTFLERYEDVPVKAGLTAPIVGLCRPAVEPQWDTLDLGDALIRIAQSIGGSVGAAFPWKNYKTCLKQTLADQWKDLEKKGYWMPSQSLQADADSKNKAGGKSGRYVLMDGTLETIYMAQDAPLEGDSRSYSMLLMPYDTIRITSLQIGAPPFVMKTVPDTVLKGQDGFIEINKKEATEMGFKQGQAVIVTTPIGEARVRVHLSSGLAPGVIAMPRGLGHTAYDDYLAGKGVNINQLIGPVEDPASGLDTALGIRAKLAKA
ncbi:MAG: molybdopterin-dependent oxidoreductase [Desulfobacteraceae bacterium]|nr:molybdopterin-dependent oxidoreductase [Desulfobacteraceae bacterium]